MKIVSLILIFLNVLSSCSKNNKPIIIHNQKIFLASIKSENGINDAKENWLIKDIQKDTIPGISLSKAAEELLIDKNGTDVIVAVIDMPISIDHKALKNNIWKNTNEIAGNHIDDDQNGYIDDIHGWNFIGNSKNENIIFMHYEFTRFLIAEKMGLPLRPELASQLPRAQKVYNERMAYAEENLLGVKKMDSFYYSTKNTLSKLFHDKIIIDSKLDSLSLSNPELQEAIELHRMYQDENVDDSYVNNMMLKAKKRIDIQLNLDYDDRAIIGDDTNNLNDRDYGNNNVSHNTEILTHGTKMAGVIVSSFEEESLQDIMKHIKIMPLPISGLGGENDKDMALAIRYAADNGADIINISSGKYFSLHEDWVHDAIKYAESKDVLIVVSSGNVGIDLDAEPKYRYPNDNSPTGHTEISNNFIRVGTSNYTLDSTFVHPATNYGKTEVDIFAPGEEIYTATSIKNEDYAYGSGTSEAAAVVSKSAAILKSYYPELVAEQLKDILLKTGVQYNIEVSMKDSSDNNIKIPFNELSKTGSVVNVYNALVLAESLTKNSSN
ncbi:S8 family serine peptidase [Maribacter litoralis]|uniref:Subtilase family protein n=1 Tax=Maribacter litoralis TaxID=2059726 RepID=A0A653NWI2_9FLAO|nr:S8 family serine peptidase [Maribacter litoralis]VXB21789.1 Subtilase family protein [Maribacter litoralis]